MDHKPKKRQGRIILVRNDCDKNICLTPTANLRVMFSEFSDIIRILILTIFRWVALLNPCLNLIMRYIEESKNGIENKPSTSLIRSSFWPCSSPLFISLQILNTSTATTISWMFRRVCAAYTSLPFGSNSDTECKTGVYFLVLVSDDGQKCNVCIFIIYYLRK